MLLYIIRHADPDYGNDTITEFGWKEARALADWFRDIPLDRIYTSPAGRAIDTAKPMLEVKGMTSEILPWAEESGDYMAANDMSPETDCEFTFSVREGVHNFKDFRGPARMERINSAMTQADQFLESCGYRRHGLFYDIVNPNDESIAVFCHGGFGTAWIGHLLGFSAGLMWPGITLNTSAVSTIVFFNDEQGYVRPKLRRLNEVAHIYKAGLKVNLGV